jgi:hypothetical protein
MRDSQLTERPGRGWTPWKAGPCDLDIEENLVVGKGLALRQAERFMLVRRLGSRRDRALGIPPAAMVHAAEAGRLTPLPDVYRKAREEEQQAAVERFRAGAHARALEHLIQASERRPSARDASAL